MKIKNGVRIGKLPSIGHPGRPSTCLETQFILHKGTSDSGCRLLTSILKQETEYWQFPLNCSLVQMGNKFPYFVSVKAIKWKSGWQSFFYIVFYQKIAGRSFLHHFCSLQLSDLEEEEVIWSGRCRQALAQIFVTLPQRTISATIFAFETIFLWIMWIEPGNIGFPNFIRSPNPMMGTRYPLKLWSAQLLVWLDIYLKTFPRESRKHWKKGCFFTGWDIWNIDPIFCDIFHFCQDIFGRYNSPCLFSIRESVLALAS